MPDITSPRLEDFSAAFDQPPEQVNRGYVGLADFPDSPALKQADAAFEFVTTSLATDNEFRITRNPRDTLASHASKLSHQVERSSSERARRIDAAKAAIKTELQQVESELQKAANLKANDKYVNAVIGTFGAMRADERVAALDQLIEQQDGPTLGVLLEAPLVTTGLTANQRDSIKTRLYDKAAPGSLALLQHLDKVLRRIEAASLPRIEAELKLLAGTNAFDGKVKAAEAVAAKAQAGLLH